MTEPTDEELEAAYDSARAFGDAHELHIDGLRAVLAKWGAPPAVAGEPVARLEIGKTQGGVSLTHIAEPAAFQLPEGMYALYTAPQPTQAQSGAGPFAAIEALKMALEYWGDRQQRYKNRHPAWVTAAREAIAAAPASHAHGIKGGQHDI
jgi:hypothetical protein